MESYDVKKISEEQTIAWDNFVESHPWGTIYHTSTWREIVRNTYGHNAQYFALFDNHDKIVAGLPVYLVNSAIAGKRYSTSPCAQVCTPLVRDSLQYDILKKTILNEMKADDVPSWEIRATAQFPYETQSAADECDQYHTYVLQLDRDPSMLYSRFHKSCIQRTISKAKRKGLDLIYCRNRKGLKDFYRLYLTMRKKEGLLPQPLRYFEVLWDKMFAKNRIDVLYALKENKVVSTVMLLRYRDTVTYEYGATEDEMKKTGASPFLIWEAIRQASLDEYKHFDFGRTGRYDEGLIQYKSRWGARAVPFIYYTISSKSSVTTLQQSNKARNMMAAMMRILPKSACRIVGRLIYRHLV